MEYFSLWLEIFHLNRWMYGADDGDDDVESTKTTISHISLPTVNPFDVRNGKAYSHRCLGNRFSKYKTNKIDKQKKKKENEHWALNAHTGGGLKTKDNGKSAENVVFSISTPCARPRPRVCVWCVCALLLAAVAMQESRAYKYQPIKREKCGQK